MTSPSSAPTSAKKQQDLVIDLCSDSESDNGNESKLNHDYGDKKRRRLHDGTSSAAASKSQCRGSSTITTSTSTTNSDDDDCEVLDVVAPAAAVAASKKRALSACNMEQQQRPTKSPPAATNTAAPSSLEPLIFISSDNDGGSSAQDNCTMTNGLMTLVRDNVPRVLFSCAGGRQRRGPGHHYYSTLQHIQQKDRWSCGFRNLQMMLTAVVPQLPSHHSYHHQQHWTTTTTNTTTSSSSSTSPDSNSGFVVVEIPSLRQLQQRMEASWREGYDAEGAQHYRHQMVGKREWIGAAEVTSLLGYMGIDATILEFVHVRESRQLLVPFCQAYFGLWHGELQQACCPHCGRRSTTSATTMTHPAAAEAAALLQEECTATTGSFEKAQSIMCQAEIIAATAGTTSSAEGTTPPTTPPPCNCSYLPLYLQWGGHSVTLVGMEQVAGKLFFLVLDPLKTGEILKSSLVQGDSKPLRLDVKRLANKDCQLVLTSLRSLDASLFHRKQLQSVRAANHAVQRFLQQRQRR